MQRERLDSFRTVSRRQQYPSGEGAAKSEMITEASSSSSSQETSEEGNLLNSAGDIREDSLNFVFLFGLATMDFLFMAKCLLLSLFFFSPSASINQISHAHSPERLAIHGKNCRQSAEKRKRRGLMQRFP